MPSPPPPPPPAPNTTSTTDSDEGAGSPEMRAALHSFQTASTPFRILHTVRAPQSPANPSAPTTLAILDASFNPPTRAHLSLATSAFTRRTPEHGAAPFAPPPSRLLLLLSVRNADKAPAPAAHAARLDMLAALAADAADALPAVDAVDVGVTTAPLFSDKSAAIAGADAYPGAAHVHLVGQDTFVRVLDARYYAARADGRGPLAALDGFFRRHGLRVTLRGDEGVQGQLDTWRALERGEMEGVGGRREWASRVEVVEGEAQAAGVSSTEARRAVQERDWDALGRLCTPRVVQYIRRNNPYDLAEGTGS